MKKNIQFFAIALCLATMCPCALFAAPSCSRASLTRCLDSVCAINVGMNPSARCQLCGTADAGSGPDGLRTVAVGTSAQNTISAAEMKKAPTDPGAKYVWASTQCIKKVPGCTIDDVSDSYDKLIEQSCRAAGISAEMSVLQSAAIKKKTRGTCETQIRACVVDAKNCTANYSLCASDADFDRVFSSCAVLATDCDEFTAGLRTSLSAARSSAFTNKQNLVNDIVTAYQNNRANKLKVAVDSCKNMTATQNCVDTVCENNMQNKCAVGFESEVSMANLLCQFNTIACDRLIK